MNKTYTLTFPCPDNDQPIETDVEFKITADITYDPGVYSGPLENSYPASGECDITEIKVLTKLDGLNNADIIDALTNQIGEDQLMDDLWEDWQLNRDSVEADRADYENERLQEAAWDLGK